MSAALTPNCSGKGHRPVSANVRAVTLQDLPSVHAIAMSCPEAAQWSLQAYSSLLRDGAQGWVAIAERSVLGFLIVRRMAEEAEILNVAVAPDARRKGVASSLLGEALLWAKQCPVSRIHLEVRASNHAARKLYESYGFLDAGLRRGYYSHPSDDALLLSRAVARE